MRAKSFALLTVSVVAFAQAARADVEISGKPTSNMSCDAGVCTATAQKAVLNVGDLANMLASGDVAVKTGLVAKDIDVDQPLQWTSTARLTLDAQQSVTIKKQVTIAGQGALTVVTNDTGQPHAKTKTGEFIIVPEHGSVQFWDLGSSLIIDGATYTLVGDIKTLAADIAANPSGFYALAKPYDASVDGTYTAPPVPTEFTGVFEGLGNAISQIKMAFASFQNAVPGGLFEDVGSTGVLRHLGIENGDIEGLDDSGLGMLAGVSYGAIFRVWATGLLNQNRVGQQAAGGLIGGNAGDVSESFAKVRIQVVSAGFSEGGGLVGVNQGTIKGSYAGGTIVYRKSENVDFGGLVGLNEGSIENSFAVNSVRDGKQLYDSECGGLVGVNDRGGRITSSYAAGLIKNHSGGASGTEIGGLVGSDETRRGHIETSYWDLDKGISDPSQGAGNKKNAPGITGLTTEQLQSGLPVGFDPKIWKQDINKNQDLPYLASLPVK